MTLLLSLTTILIIISFGIICYKKELFNTNQIAGLELLLFKIIMPAYLFLTSYENNLHELINIKYITSYLSTFAIVTIIVMVIFIKRLSSIDICIRILASSYVNAAIYTLPVITILLKNSTAAIIGNMLQVIILQPIFIIFLSSLKYKSLVEKILNVLKTPIIMMPIMGILLNYLQITLPSPMVGAISQLGHAASSLALFMFGLTLGATKITAQCLRFDLLSMVFIKNFIHPLVAIGIAYLMKLEGYWFDSLVIAASAPSAFVVYLIAQKFSTDAELIKKVIALSSVISTISLVFITMIIG